jgi:prolyl oligopeptidase
MSYPAAPRTDQIDIIHGVAVPDPFRRLESADDPGTVAWVTAQNALTRQSLDTPLRTALTARLRDLHHVPRMSVAAVRGDRIFFTENDGSRAQPVLCVTHVGADPSVPPSQSYGEARQSAKRGGGRPGADTWVGPYGILVDPNLLDADGTTAITVFEPDDTGNLVVYGLSRHGSDMQELLIHDVANGASREDRLQWVKFASIAWSGNGFFYTRYPLPGTVPPEHEQYFCQVWFHRIGDPQAADRLIHHRPDAPEVVFDVHVTSDGRHLVIASYQGASDHAEIHVVPLDDTVRLKPDTANAQSTDAQPLVTGFSSGWHFIDGRDGHLYFRTDKGAPFGQIVRIDVNAERLEEQVIVAESGDTIVDAVVANGRLLVSSLRQANSRLATWSLDGGDERHIALPGIGTITGLGARWTDARAFATFTSFTMPPAIMACEDGVLVPLRPGTLPFNPADYIIEQVWYRSKDGTPISMFLIGRPEPRTTDAGGCVLLTGYGGFNISLTPSFDPSDFLWLDAGGAIAVANLRGGGEYGDAWHRAGMRERKQNVFDDFIAAAEWLESSGLAARGRVAIEGGSNGGLLVGACLTQRPELFGAAICRVPVADMLRYHLFTVGRFWIPEYGCADAPDDFPFLLAYSPYHNVVDGTAYPPTLIMTADTDDRVSPGMAKKFAARLQEAERGAAGGPVLLRVEARAGHGAGKPLEKQIEEQVDLYAFLFHYLTRTSVSGQTRLSAASGS